MYVSCSLSLPATGLKEYEAAVVHHAARVCKFWKTRGGSVGWVYRLSPRLLGAITTESRLAYVSLQSPFLPNVLNRGNSKVGWLNIRTGLATIETLKSSNTALEAEETKFETTTVAT